jgi:hypothetical protein
LDPEHVLAVAAEVKVAVGRAKIFVVLEAGETPLQPAALL